MKILMFISVLISMACTIMLYNEIKKEVMKGTFTYGDIFPVTLCLIVSWVPVVNLIVLYAENEGEIKEFLDTPIMTKRGE